MSTFETTFTLLPSQSGLLEIAVKLLNDHRHGDYYAYERGELWHVGLGSRSSLLVNPSGTNATINDQATKKTFEITGSVADVAREFLGKHSVPNGKIFGYVGFNYAAHSQGQTFKPGNWPLLSLLVPRIEITLAQDRVTIKGDDAHEINTLYDLIRAPLEAGIPRPSADVNTLAQGDEYLKRVVDALSEIAAGKYEKVIASRAVELAEKFDVPGTLLRGRRSNTPARSFALSHEGFEATGFSPELVMLLADGKVTTEPLAGTRSREGSAAEVEKLRNDLVSDPKEIVEHVISVREAIEELNRVCAKDTVAVEDFMSIRPRGSVQHLGSRVAGSLAPGKDAWDAFNVLFPSITASGIPKLAALQAIQRLEPQPRELYSGAVLLIEGAGFFEATLVLRTIFQDASRRWLQAGAGVISQSIPEREFTETREKLASIAPYAASALA
ncbi:ADC synthase [Fusarium albosuccineum]|uniref:ADC synthase n=1 Tax=Fusarium albosuccineum TaxID=1237068 RepID=A0A8H4KZI1_9HYPO|nr:ADC synthase [Fusarium albosuccineum]